MGRELRTKPDDLEFLGATHVAIKGPARLPWTEVVKVTRFPASTRLTSRGHDWSGIGH
jgi:hypothetical protein